MAEKLKPCPFCGGEAKKFTAPVMKTQMFICQKCGADVCFFGAEHEPKATEAWNRRADNIVELPCKVGAKLYGIVEFLENASHPEIYELEAYDITIGYCDNESTIMYTIDGCNYKFDDFGKTVFLTREEAEKALMERGSDD